MGMEGMKESEVGLSLEWEEEWEDICSWITWIPYIVELDRMALFGSLIMLL
jgi:hypothetical protein